MLTQDIAHVRRLTEKHGGASRDRTDDLIVANDALSQLSYSPTRAKDMFGFYQSSRAIQNTLSALSAPGLAGVTPQLA